MIDCCIFFSLLNSFSTNVPLLYPLKTSENRRGYRSGTLIENGLKAFSKFTSDLRLGVLQTYVRPVQVYSDFGSGEKQYLIKQPLNDEFQIIYIH